LSTTTIRSLTTLLVDGDDSVLGGASVDSDVISVRRRFCRRRRFGL
jgi:hypothetical protein